MNPVAQPPFLGVPLMVPARDPRPPEPPGPDPVAWVACCWLALVITALVAVGASR